MVIGPTDGGVAPSESGPASLRGAARAGSRWTALQFGGARITTFLVFLVLARLLSPAEFGVVAIATVFVNLLQIVMEGGFSLALIQRADLERGHVDTVFWTSVVSAVLLAGGLSLAAGPLARVYGEPVLAQILPVLACGLVVSSLGSTQAAQLRRALRFRPLAVRAVLSNVVAGAAGITLAFMGAGVWALVVQYTTLSLVQTAVLWASTSWRPGFGGSRRHFVDVFAFSRHSLGNALLQFARNRGDDFLIGAVLGPLALGFYTVAYRLLSTLNDVINQAMLGVAFPVFSRMQHDTERLSRAYTTALRVGASVAFPGYLFFTVAAPEVVEVVFGTRWLPAAPVMAVLAMFGAVQTTLMITDSCLNAIGRPQVVLRNRLICTAVQIAAFAVAAPFGIIWVAWSLVVATYLLAALPVWSLSRAGVVTMGGWLRVFVVPAIAAGTMLGVTMLVRSTVLMDLGAPMRLILMAVVSISVYAAVLALLDRTTTAEIVSLLKPGPRRPVGRHRAGDTRTSSRDVASTGAVRDV